MSENKSYLEQLKEYCQGAGLIFSINFDFKLWNIHVKRTQPLYQMMTSDESLEKLCEYTLKHLKKQESSTPHEDALMAYCKEREYTITKESNNFEPRVNLIVRDNKGKILNAVFENPFRTTEEGCELLLKALIEGHRKLAKHELQKFCEEEGLKFVAMGPESIWVGGFGLSGHVFASYQKAITRLEEMKANKEWKWEDK